MALFPTRDGTDSASSADRNSAANQNFENPGSVSSQQNVQATVSGAVTIDCEDGEAHEFKDVTGNITGLTLSKPVGAQVIIITLTDDGSGPYTFAYTSTVEGVGGTTYSTTVASQTDIITLMFRPNVSKWVELSVGTAIA